MDPVKSQHLKKHVKQLVRSLLNSKQNEMYALTNIQKQQIEKDLYKKSLDMYDSKFKPNFMTL